MKHLVNFEEILVKIEKFLIVLFIFFMVFLSFFQIILRLFFHSGIIWLDPFLRYVVLWTGLLGAGLCARYSKHFAIDAFVRIIPQKFSKVIKILVNIWTIFVSILLFSAAYKFLRDEFIYKSTAFYINKIPVKSGYVEIIVPLAFILIGFHFLMNFFREKETVPIRGQSREI